MVDGVVLVTYSVEEVFYAVPERSPTWFNPPSGGVVDALSKCEAEKVHVCPSSPDCEALGEEVWHEAPAEAGPYEEEWEELT